LGFGYVMGRGGTSVKEESNNTTMFLYMGGGFIICILSVLLRDSRERE